MNRRFNEIIRRNIKGVLAEGLSQKLYHFTSLENAYQIMRTGVAKLSDTLWPLVNGRDYAGDAEYPKKRPFYLSLSRSRNGDEGYGVCLKDVDHKFSLRASGAEMVRFELDGERLGARYHGEPFDFFRRSSFDERGRSDKQIMSDPSSPIDLHKRRFHSQFETEDRLYSYEPVIEDFLRYVVRVDVYINSYDPHYLEWRRMAEEDDRIHLYDITDWAAFNRQKKCFTYYHGEQGVSDMAVEDEPQVPRARLAAIVGFHYKYIVGEGDMGFARRYWGQMLDFMERHGFGDRANMVCNEIEEMYDNDWTAREAWWQLKLYTGKGFNTKDHDLTPPNLLSMIHEIYRSCGCRCLGDYMGLFT